MVVLYKIIIKWISNTTSHPLTNFEILKCYKNEPRFNGVYSRDNLSIIKDGAYIINLDEYSDMELIGLLCMCKIMLLRFFLCRSYSKRN